MKRNKKRLIYTFVISMLLSNVAPALAYTYKDSVANVEYTDVTKNEANNTTVYAEVGSFFKVTIPKHIILNGITKSGAYTVNVEGDIASTEVVKVVPDEAVVLKSNFLADVTANITQDKTSWGYAEMLEGSAVVSNGAIDAKDITAGSWNGNFNFNISLHDEANIHTVTFNANGGNCDVTEASIEYGSSYGTLPTPTMYMKKFIEWRDENNNIINENSIVNINNNHTLTAHYEDATLNDLTWTDIKQLIIDKEFTNYFKVGDSKTDIFNEQIFTMEVIYIQDDYVDFMSKESPLDRTDLSSDELELTFSTNKRPTNLSYVGSPVENYLENTIYASFSNDLKNAIIGKTCTYDIGKVTYGSDSSGGAYYLTTKTGNITETDLVWLPNYEEMTSIYSNKTTVTFNGINRPWWTSTLNNGNKNYLRFEEGYYYEYGDIIGNYGSGNYGTFGAYGHQYAFPICFRIGK